MKIHIYNIYNIYMYCIYYILYIYAVEIPGTDLLQKHVWQSYFISWTMKRKLMLKHGSSLWLTYFLSSLHNPLRGYLFYPPHLVFRLSIGLRIRPLKKTESGSYAYTWPGIGSDLKQQLGIKIKAGVSGSLVEENIEILCCFVFLPRNIWKPI